MLGQLSVCQYQALDLSSMAKTEISQAHNNISYVVLFSSPFSSHTQNTAVFNDCDSEVAIVTQVGGNNSVIWAE